jgi:hypothetical protein
LTDIGLADIFGGGACPESFTSTVGFLGSFEFILITAAFLPKGIAGVNVIVIVHDTPAAIIVQLLI